MNNNSQAHMQDPLPTPRPKTTLARTSTRLTEPWITAAVEGTQPSRPGWSERADGWTADRIRIFLVVLAECGVVGDAARAAGMSRQKAYAFRNSARGRAFAFAWRTALLRARDRLADEVMSRALHGCVDVIVRDGEVWGERHRFDNRLTMAVLTRLDTLAELRNVQDDASAMVEPEYDELVDRVCEGGQATAAFLRARCPTAYWRQDRAAELDRAGRYVESGSGLADEEPAAEQEEEGDEAVDWDALLCGDEEEEPDLPSQTAAEGCATAKVTHEWHVTPSSPSSPHLSSPGFPGGDTRVGGTRRGGEAARHAGDMPERKAGLQDSPCEAVEGESSPAGGEGVAAPKHPPFPCAAAEPEWILGDDGIAIPLINGRIPPHLRRRTAHPRG